MAKTQGVQIFQNKKVTMIIALIIAVVFWFTINLIENPKSTRVVGSIPIYLDTAGTMVDEQGLSIINMDDANKNVSVKISGASYIVNSVSTEDILVKPSFDGVNASGKYSIKLIATNNSTKNFTIESVTPEALSVEFDYMDTVSYDVQIKVKGASAANGLTLGTERFTNSETASIDVTGPRSIVSRISTVCAVVNADKSKKLTATESYDASIKLYDASNKVIKSDALKLSVETISVSVPVYKTKTVPVRCTYDNKPTNYSPKTSLTIGGASATTIKIEGTPDIIDQTDFIELESISFFEISNTNNIFQKNFILPSGITTVNGEKAATVTINNSSLTSKSFSVGKAVAVNNTGGYSIKLNQSIKVKMCGQKSVIRNLSASNLYLEIDLDGKTVGEQTLSATVKSKVSDNVWQVGTYEAKVTITK